MDMKLKLVVCFLVYHFAYSEQENDGFKIGAFNVQIFGISKMKKTAVANILVHIISRYDIILIQEIRDKSGQAVEELLNQINARNKQTPYSMKISPRLGRSQSKEQYAFMYKESADLTVLHDYVYDDVNLVSNSGQNITDNFEREPYIVMFESSTTVLKRFVLAGLHISPSKAVSELQALEGVFEDIRARLNTSEIMLMGDFNADCSYVPNYKWENIPIKIDPSYTWWIEDDVDTTVGNTYCAYDRFISTGQGFKTAIVNTSATVFYFDTEFMLNQTFSLNVSDHYPIEFQLVTDTTTNAAIQMFLCNIPMKIIATCCLLVVII